MAVSYIFGTVLSAIAGKIGIMVAALSNARAALLWAVGDASILLGFLYPLLFFKHLDKNRKKPYNLTIFIRRNQDGKNS